MQFRRSSKLLLASLTRLLPYLFASALLPAIAIAQAGLTDADIEYLSRDTPRWKKWYLYPVLRILFFWLPRDIGANAETREKLANTFGELHDQMS